MDLTLRSLLKNIKCPSSPTDEFSKFSDSIVSLRKTIGPALESMSHDNIKKHFRKVRHYMFAYLEELPGGSDLEKLVKKYKVSIKSYRRISEVQ